ncbi:MAG: GNAT family N-acetyltransferase [Thermoplasmatota archaeon]
MTLPNVEPAYRFRRADDNDLVRVVPMWLRLLAFEAQLEPRFVPKPGAETVWLDELRSDREGQRADIFLAELGGEPVAFLHVRATRGAPFHKEERLGFIDAVWVEPEHRRHKIAERLLGEAETWCRARRLTLLEAGVVARNNDAMKAWLALGFQMTSAVMTLKLTAHAASARAVPPSALALAKSVRRLVDFAQIARGARVLDLAGREGILLIAFGEAGAASRVGLYPTHAAAMEARARGAARVVAHPGALPFRDESFTQVVERETLSRVAAPERVAAEASRVLAPLGVFVLEEIVAHEDPARAERYAELARLSDPRVTRILPASVLKHEIATALLDPEEMIAVHEPRELGAWLADTPPAHREEVEKRAREYADRPEHDETGLGLRLIGNEVRYDQRRVLLRGRKPGGR